MISKIINILLLLSIAAFLIAVVCIPLSYTQPSVAKAVMTMTNVVETVCIMAALAIAVIEVIKKS